MDDKKKTLVLVGLFVMLIAVGVFQFIPKGGDPAPVATKKAAPGMAQALAANTPEPPKNPGLPDLNPRDPFQAPYVPPPPTVVTSTPPKTIVRDSKPSVPFTLPEATIGIQAKNDLPTGKLEGIKDPKATDLPLDKPTPPEPTFAYTLSGVLVGRKPLAVFKDSAGNQRLVAQGQRVDADTILKSIDLKHATVLFHGKKLVLELEGGSVAKQ